jgi:hypothetical protein
LIVGRVMYSFSNIGISQFRKDLFPGIYPNSQKEKRAISFEVVIIPWLKSYFFDGKENDCIQRLVLVFSHIDHSCCLLTINPARIVSNASYIKPTRVVTQTSTQQHVF